MTDPTFLVIPAVHVVTLVITATSALYVLRQKTTEYQQVRNLLAMVHFLYMGVVSLELVRNLLPNSFPPSVSTQAILTVYTLSGTTFVLADVFLLTLIALAIYYRPNGRSVFDILREVFKHQAQSTFFSLYAVYLLFAGGYLFASQPFGPQLVPNIFGSMVLATLYDSLYLDMLLGILLIFIAYPSIMLFAARARSRDEDVRQAFTILPIAWIGIGVDLLFFNGYLLNAGVDASSIGYLFAAAAFAVTAATFRRATLLTSFFQAPAVTSTSLTPATTFSGRLGLQTERVVGKEYLLEVDPSVRYEESLKDLALELGANQYVIFAFTSRGSPVHNVLSGLDNVRFFTMTAKVSYPKPGEMPNEVMVPGSDQSVLLNVLDKAMTSNPNLKFGVVFDSISDLILSSGLEMTYKFLKQANEMLSNRQVTAVFLITLGAHSERESNIVKSLFSNLLTYRGGQLAVLKTG